MTTHSVSLCVCSLRSLGCGCGTTPTAAATDAADDKGEDGDEETEQKGAYGKADYLTNSEVCE